jgi:hypothetical protein
MGRIKTAAQKQREAQIALARENYLKNRPANASTTVRSRKTNNYVYRAYSLKSGTNQQLITLLASDAAVAFFTLDGLDLKLPSTVTDPTIARPKNFQPAMIKAMVGATAPTAKVNAWGSRVIKYSAATDGTAQAHYSAPICIETGTTNFDVLDAKAQLLFTSVKSKLGNEDYARFYLSGEQLTVPKI